LTRLRTYHAGNECRRIRLLLEKPFL